jgi:glycosyltransferase involved in cell wall biosynthesis
MLAYFTADRLGLQTGGGVVTKNEHDALAELGTVELYNPTPTQNPFETEKQIDLGKLKNIKLAHFYSGTFPDVVAELKKNGTKVVYTAAAHDVDLSKQEFESLGLKYDLPHLTNPSLKEKYLSSYLLADIVICPSNHSKQVMENFGCKNVKVIPHGCHALQAKPYPKTFTVGYLGQIGPDKGLRYLFEAWNMLNYDDAVLNLAGYQSIDLIHMARFFGKGNINIMGFVKNIEDFYNSINLYVQPSVTEGFGIEILEALSAGRPVVASDGAGASDCVGECGIVVPKRNPEALAKAIDSFKNKNITIIENCQNQAKKYTWDKIRPEYIKVWKELLR